MRLPSSHDHSGRDLGADELQALQQVLASGHLNSTRGQAVPALEQTFATRMGAQHAIACSSGTAALHAAFAALDAEPGDEVITTPITDMGAILPILYEGLIPVFADVDPTTGNVTAQTIQERMGPRTKAVVATHLFGRPCAMDSIRAICSEQSVVLIEDAAQAFGASWKGEPVGSFGNIACYSLQQAKHMTTGEGGLVTTDDPEVAGRIQRFINKGWDYQSDQPDHCEPGLNYRMTELQGAVGEVQLHKLDTVITARRQAYEQLSSRLDSTPLVTLPTPDSGAFDVHWRVPLLIDKDQSGSAKAFAQMMSQAGAPAQAGYIGKPAFQCPVLMNAAQLRPFSLVLKSRGLQQLPHNDPALFPHTFSWLDRIVVLPWNERYTAQHVNFVADTIQHAAANLPMSGVPQ